MAVLTFFAWMGVCALASWLTAFRMPDGYGNAIFLVQFFGAFVSAGYMAMGLPTAIDPTTKVVVSGGHGNPNRVTTWPRRKGVKLAIIGGVVFVVSNLGGYILDRALGIPSRHLQKAERAAEGWVRGTHPALEACLATTWSREPVACTLAYRVSATDDVAVLELDQAMCPHAAIQACATRHLAHGTVSVDERQLATLSYASAGRIKILGRFRGTGAPPPNERE